MSNRSRGARAGHLNGGRRLRHTACLFVDASLCTRTKAAGWGAWFKRDGMDRGELSGGAFRGPMDGSNAAELAGIANAVYWAAHAALLRQGDVLLIQCDNAHALAQIRRACGAYDNPAKLTVGIGGPVVTRIEREALDFLRATIEPNEIQLGVRHVKGHTSNDDGRSWVNDTCDKIAKRHMREARNQLKGPTDHGC